MTSHILIPITDATAVGEARRVVGRIAESAGLDATDAGRASIIVTELANNLARHTRPANGGMMLIAPRPGEAAAIEIIAMDRGPGMENISRCFEDGFSTHGTPGNGLGAVRRLSDEIDLFSAPTGTVLWARVGRNQDKTASHVAQQNGALRAAGIAIPAPGEIMCGDAMRVARLQDGAIALMIADGLGHGPYAADAAHAACDAFDANPQSSPEILLEAMHTRISATRGAAVGIARIEPAQNRLLFAGIGNIAGTLIAPDRKSRGLFSHNGTVGHQVRKFQLFDYPWSQASTVILHSDGLQTRWALDAYPGLSRRHPSVIAGILYRDFQRGRDDASVLVIGPPSQGQRAI